MSDRPKWEELSRPERVRRVSKLAEQGLSTAQIAQRFEGVSRNAIIGVCHRYKITLARAQSQREPAYKVAADRKQRQAKAAKKLSSVSIKAIPADIVDLDPISKADAFSPIKGAEPVLLENLGAHQCHWPVSGFAGTEPLLCGMNAASLYCQSHTRLAYQNHG